MKQKPHTVEKWPKNLAVILPDQDYHLLAHDGAGKCAWNEQLRASQGG